MSKKVSQIKSVKSRTTAMLLALFLGGLGAHKFYLGQTIWGLVYLIFCWTLIPALVSLVEFYIFLTMSDEVFNTKYNYLDKGVTRLKCGECNHDLGAESSKCPNCGAPLNNKEEQQTLQYPTGVTKIKTLLIKKWWLVLVMLVLSTCTVVFITDDEFHEEYDAENKYAETMNNQEYANFVKDKSPERRAKLIEIHSKARDEYLLNNYVSEDDEYKSSIKKFLNDPIEYRVSLFMGQIMGLGGLKYDRLPQIKDKCGDAPVNNTGQPLAGEQFDEFQRAYDKYWQCMLSTLAELGPNIYIDFKEHMDNFDRIRVPSKFSDFAEDYKIRLAWELQNIYLKIIEYRARSAGDETQNVNWDERVGQLYNLNIEPDRLWSEATGEEFAKSATSQIDKIQESDLRQPDSGIKFEDLEIPPTPKPKRVEIVERMSEIVILWDSDGLITYALSDKEIADFGNFRRVQFVEKNKLRQGYSETQNEGKISYIEIDCYSTPYKYRYLNRLLYFRDSNYTVQDDISQKETNWQDINGYDCAMDRIIHYVCQFGQQLE